MRDAIPDDMWDGVQVREKGGTSDDVKWDAERRFIKLEDVK